MIIQNVGRDKGETDVTFTVPAADLIRSIDMLESAKDKIGFNRILSDDKVAKVSVVGVGMKSHAGVASTMFRALADRGLNIRSEERRDGKECVSPCRTWWQPWR